MIGTDGRMVARMSLARGCRALVNFWGRRQKFTFISRPMGI
jgi:hypothetical protein